MNTTSVIVYNIGPGDVYMSADTIQIIGVKERNNVRNTMKQRRKMVSLHRQICLLSTKSQMFSENQHFNTNKFSIVLFSPSLLQIQIATQ